jgi:glycerol-3-phosphate acyltransferase PlsY
MLTPLLIAAVLGYVLGSLPFGYLVARAKGVNIFEVGSKNPGATNVRRVLGSGPGNLVLFLDGLKGAVASAWTLLRFRESGDTSGAIGSGTTFLNLPVSGDGWAAMGIAGLVGALLGHSFSCFTKFKGGKGVATGAGGFLVLFPFGMVIALAVFGLTLAVTRYVSLSSMLGAVALAIAAVALKAPTFIVGATGAVALFVILRHRTNISRLLAGTESKVGQSKSRPATSPSAPKS